VDLGAESGRVARVTFDGHRFEVDVERRFLHSPHERDGRLHWNMAHLWSEIAAGLDQLGQQTTVRSVGVDTFGVDYGLLGSSGQLIEDPVTYRDSGRSDVFDGLVETHTREAFYRQTGTQVLPINTLFGLCAELERRPQLLRDTSSMVMLADVFHHILSGQTLTELTAVSTSGLFDMQHNRWAWDLIDTVGLPRGIFPEVVPPGTTLGRIRGELAVGGLSTTDVILPAAHDTASAVASITVEGPPSMFISSGTWSLVGVLTPKPVVTDTTYRLNLTNEAGYPNNIRLLRNLMGLWMVQECRREWESQGLAYDYADLAELAGREPALISMVDPADNAFLAPGGMPARIQAYCRDAGLPVPETPAQIVRTIVDSLAMSYRITAEDLRLASGQPIECVRVVGGGVNNALLQQATADATGLSVITGAAEATVLGNAIVQMIALGEFDGLEQAWDAVSRSVEERTYQPNNTQPYDDHAELFRGLAARVRASRGGD